MKVLLIDDDITILKSIGKALSINGIPNCQFTDPVEAVNAYKTDSFDVVVTDLKMPEMTGIEVLEKIKMYNPDSVVIILSAYDDSSYRNTAINAGAFAFFHKSVKFDEFLETLLGVAKQRNIDV